MSARFVHFRFFARAFFAWFVCVLLILARLLDRNNLRLRAAVMLTLMSVPTPASHFVIKFAPVCVIEILQLI